MASLFSSSKLRFPPYSDVVTPRQPLFSYLMWAEHMMAFGILALIMGLGPVTEKYALLRAAVAALGLFFILWGLTRYIKHFFSRHYR
jgi:hypothetical protein